MKAWAVIFCAFGLLGKEGAFGYFCARLSKALLRFPKSLIGLVRRAILTAAPSSPRFIRHWRRFGDDATAASRNETDYHPKTKNKSKNQPPRQQKQKPPNKEKGRPMVAPTIVYPGKALTRGSSGKN